MESPTLRSDEGLSTTWSDQPGCLPRVNLQLPHKDHFNYTVQTSLKSPIFPFVYLRECHINWLITVFLSHFQKTHGGKRGEGEKGKLSMPHSWKQQQKKKDRHGGMRRAGCSLRRDDGKGVQCSWSWCAAPGWQKWVRMGGGMASSGNRAQGAQGEGWGHRDPALAQQHSPDHDPAPSTCPRAGLSPPWLLCPTQANERKQLFRGVIPFTCILCCIIQE